MTADGAIALTPDDNILEGCLRHHELDGEGDPSEIEVAFQNFPSDLFNQLPASTPQLLNVLHILYD